ncbi:hypothetical protein CDD82_4098 [Ophiocordyceps australis]|uniref:GP-PDE domain-containing protein n=1 Tax=Ophiocordyceps australis TaxID=1399860 RepID=A0A2C5ZU66_9HYPO|nr:hypothetical protein CDD82_4098 [Ophiocordyceps australis]
METVPQVAASFTAARPSTKCPKLLIPQAVAHRGFRAQEAENTMAAFCAAARAGAQGIETDVRLSRDGVAVLSHDGSLQRCFGVEGQVAQREWAQLARLRTVRDARQGMPRLRDLLAWLAGRPFDGGFEAGEGVEVEGGVRERLWVLLDIKMDDDAQTLVDAIATAIAQVPPSSVPWEQRIVLGCWNASTVRAARTSLPTFPLSHIGVSLSYASHFLAPPASLPAFNLAYPPLLLRGPSLLDKLRSARRAVFLWTLNDQASMNWALTLNTLSSSLPDDVDASQKHARVDAVISDDPALFLDVCAKFEARLASNPSAPLTHPPLTTRAAIRRTLGLVFVQLLMTLIFLYRRFWLYRLDYMNEATPSRHLKK